MLSSAFSAAAQGAAPVGGAHRRRDRAPARRDRRGTTATTEMSPFLRRFFQFGPGMPEPTPGPQRGTGSGVVMDARGSIVTNRHVVSGATRLKVTFSDGREFTREDAGGGRGDGRRRDPAGEAARGSGGGAAGRLGQARRGRVGAGGGQPAGPGSDRHGRDRQRPGQGRAGTCRCRAAACASTSRPTPRSTRATRAGRWSTCRPRWSGINTLINTGPGGAYGFAIPINQVRMVATSLLKEGRVRYAYLGVLVGDIEAAGPRREGARCRRREGRATSVR